jgi:hypothetical protein
VFKLNIISFPLRHYGTTSRAYACTGFLRATPVFLSVTRVASYVSLLCSCLSRVAS